MTIFADNIRFLRSKEGLSQQKLADNLIITRARLSKYEEGKSEPPLEVLKRISKYFHVSIDILVTVNLKKIPLDTLLKMEDNRILLPITVDKQGKDFIEIVPHKAKAGYLNGYSDPEFIESLQQIHLPFIRGGKHRAFPIEGDSMPPHKEGSFVVGKYVENLNQVTDGKTYVVVSKIDGIIYKRAFKKNKKDQTLILHSDNPVYKPIEIKPQSILEIWEYVCSINTKEYKPDDLSPEHISEMFRQLQFQISELKSEIN